MSENNRRTKRRYAHELYPHPDEWEVRNIGVEVPYLYARAIGMDVRGTGWFNAEPKESVTRTNHMLDAQQIALMADAMFQGLTGQEAWAWTSEHMSDDGELVYERTVHYGVNPDLIKPYPCGPTPDHHDHHEPIEGSTWLTVTRAPGAEDDCTECTECTHTEAAK
ncbi:hypothetical protein ACQCSX_04310 [Pseudarthrobacter sp. P1]|uniref:hypothetical protein n=1 Tax=Pseudarthrobacter sp. P1 TaxID=3418418 RepID=UPI003CE76B04